VCDRLQVDVLQQQVQDLLQRARQRESDREREREQQVREILKPSKQIAKDEKK